MPADAQPKVESQKNNHKQFLTFLKMDLTNFLLSPNPKFPENQLE